MKTQFLTFVVLLHLFWLGATDFTPEEQAIRHRLPDFAHKRWCHRDWPSKEGKWTDEAPYWTSSPDCPNRAFGEEETKTCMKGRTLYAAGNSVSRQALFGMLEMMGGGSVKRTDQRDECPKHETTWDDSCHHEWAGVKLKFLHLRYMDNIRYNRGSGKGGGGGGGGFPFFDLDKAKEELQRLPGYNNDTRYEPIRKHHWHGHDQAKYRYSDNVGRIWNPVTQEYYTDPRIRGGDLDSQYSEDDSCLKQSMRLCLQYFFKDATKDDIFVFALGGDYPSETYRYHHYGDATNIVDELRWLRASALHFHQHLAAVFPGQVFRVTIAQPNPRGHYSFFKPQFDLLNHFLWEETGFATDVEGMSGQDRPWYTIDQWAINNDRFHLYNDDLHFNGPLTHAMLHQVLNEMCPDPNDPTGRGVEVARGNLTEAAEELPETVPHQRHHYHHHRHLRIATSAG